MTHGELSDKGQFRAYQMMLCDATDLNHSILWLPPSMQRPGLQRVWILLEQLAERRQHWRAAGLQVEQHLHSKANPCQEHVQESGTGTVAEGRGKHLRLDSRL